MKSKWLLIIMAGLIVLSGCAKTKKTESQPENSTASEKSSPQVKIDKDKGTVEFENENIKGRAEVGEDVQLPDSFPDDVPVYDGAKILSAITNESENLDTMMVTLQSDDSVKDVFQFYLDQLSQNGFSITNQREDQSTAVLSSNKDVRTVAIVCSRRNDVTSIGINISTRRE